MRSGPPLPGLAARLVDLAAAGRTVALRLLSPLEQLFRWRRRALEPLPPLWLRRHAGPLRAFRISSGHAMALLDRLGLIRPDTRVLDFGCGPGGLVPRLARSLGPEGKYLGLDVHRPSIAWCRRAFAGDPRLAFRELDPRSPRPWPVDDGTWDLVLAKSVFTHLLEAEARAALGEIRRALSPAGCAMVTAFLFDGAAFARRALPWFPCPDGTAPVRWRRAARPTAAVAVEAATFRSWAAAAGLEVVTLVPGYLPGGAAPPTGQDTLILALRDEARRASSA